MSTPAMSPKVAASPGSKVASGRGSQVRSEGRNQLGSPVPEELLNDATSALEGAVTDVVVDQLVHGATEPQGDLFAVELGEEDAQGAVEGSRASKARSELSGEDVLGAESPCVKEGEGIDVGDSNGVKIPSPNVEGEEEKEECEEDAARRLQEELREIAAREEEMEPVLKAYEEVIELRREAELLEGDRKRASLQVELGDISSYYDADVEREVGELEAAVENSYLQACWAKERQRYISRNETDLPEWWRVNLKDLAPRLRGAKKTFDENNRVAQELYGDHGKLVNANTDARDKAKAELFSGVRTELDALKAKRVQLQRLQKDQMFHLRRGTHVKDQLLTPLKERDVCEARLADMERKLVEKRYELNDEIQELNGDIEALRRTLSNQRCLGQESLDALKKSYVDIEDSRGEISSIREKYERENSELLLLKHDLQCVLHYVRVQAREADR